MSVSSKKITKNQKTVPVKEVESKTVQKAGAKTTKATKATKATKNIDVDVDVDVDVDTTITKTSKSTKATKATKAATPVQTAGAKIATKPVAKPAAKTTTKPKTATKTATKTAAKTSVKKTEVIEDDSTTHKNVRSFKVMLPDAEAFIGRFTGLTPYQAANKALSKYYRENKKPKADIQFSIRESTRGSKRSTYTYKGGRQKLDEPVKYTISNENGESRDIIKNFKNRLTKVKKSELAALE